MIKLLSSDMTREAATRSTSRRASDRKKSTVAQQRAHNIHVRDGIGIGVGVDEFVAMRRARDAILDVPTLILPSIQVNVRGGRLPPADDIGVS